MHRIFGLLALAAAGFGVWVLFSSPDPDAIGRMARTASDTPRRAYSGWALGLLMGLVLAWLATIDWRDFPDAPWALAAPAAPPAGSHHHRRPVRQRAAAVLSRICG